MKTSLLPALAICGLACTAAAQQPEAPLAEAFRGIADRAGDNLVATAREMPAGKYDFKPTPAQATFGHSIGHVAEGNDYLCSKIGGVAAPERADIGEAAAKEKLVTRLEETFAFCRSALERVDDSDLGAKVPFFGGREITRAEAILRMTQLWADHYSQLAIYLRLNGLLPPTAKQKEG